MRILFIGDVCGATGRRALEDLLPPLRDRLEPDFVVVNGENVAGGLGITSKLARTMLDDLRVDAITLGNHAYRHNEVWPYLDAERRIVRPANFNPGNPGRGHTVVERDGARLGVLNLQGQVFMETPRSPFTEADALLPDLRARCDALLVDFHAEATSEKIAMGWHLDGRATACVGTHTHVPTADARVLPGGTAFISDVGMTGARGGVIGMTREPVLERFVTGMPVRFEGDERDPWLMGVLIEADGEGRATGISQVLEPLEG